MGQGIYSLNLHETLLGRLRWGVRFDITRVPGGWIYQPINRLRNGADQHLTPCFVPFDNEFQEKTDSKNKDETQ